MRCIVLLVSLWILPLGVFAQTAAPQGSVTGVVLDQTGAVLQGATISIKGTDSEFARSTLTDQAGRYVFDALPPGRYQVTTAVLGFEAATRDVVVTAGRSSALDFSLGLARRESVVQVTAAPTTLGQEVIAFHAVRTSDTAAMLDAVPGVSFYGNGGVSTLPAIHGMADDRVRIKVDGMDLISACANHMNPPLSYIDPSNVGSIDVFAGITPVSMGGDSIGGTISVNSPAPEFAMAGQRSLLKGQAGSFYRSNANAYGANLRALIATETLSLTYNASVSHSDNYRAAADFKSAGPAAADRGYLAGNVVGSSRYESQNHALGLALKRDRHQVEFTAGVQHIPYQGFPNQRMDMTANDSVRGTLRYSSQYTWGALDARVYADQTRHKMDFANDKQYVYGSAATILAPGMPMNTKGRTLGAVVKTDVVWSTRGHLRIGVEAQRYRLDDWWPPSPAVLPPGYTTGGMAPNTFMNINHGQRDRLGVYTEWEARWNPKWTTLLGMRGEAVLMNTGTVQGYNNTMMYDGAPLYPATTFNSRDRKRTDRNLDLTALGRYAPGATLDFEAGYARKTRSPNLYERYAWSTNTMAMEMINFAGDGNYYTGNLNLSPEVAHTVSATASWHSASRNQWGLAVTPYYTYVQDYIDARRCPSTVCGSSAAVTASATATRGFVYLQFANQSARLYGIDVSGRALFARTSDYGSFQASGVVSVVRGENRTTSDQLYHMMPLNATLAVVHNVGRLTTTLEGILVADKRDVSQVRNETATRGYGVLNLRSSLELGTVRVEVGVDNALNKAYAAPLGGAYVGQGPTMSGSAIPWGTPIPGMGRSFYGSVGAKF